MGPDRHHINIAMSPMAKGAIMQEDKDLNDQPEATSDMSLPSVADLAALTAAPDAALQIETPEERMERLTPAAKRALAEAEERRKQHASEAQPKELGGRGGLDPARYGDWEIKGRAIDF